MMMRTVGAAAEVVDADLDMAVAVTGNGVPDGDSDYLDAVICFYFLFEFITRSLA